MDVHPSPPAVVAIVVACDSGDWLEESLGALAGQDYPNLAVLVVDAASAMDPTRRVAEVMPSAYVRRVTERSGFAAAANEVIGVVEGASHFVFCHDDVALAPDAVRLLVEEAFRSNAGVVTPKLVRWAAPDRLLAVGSSADKGGIAVPFVDRDELDQEQHDAVRDVFAAPPGCVFVRADLFVTLGGFDAAMRAGGAELDLCWRAQVAGARVVVAPQAVVRHLEATAAGLRSAAGTPTDPDSLKPGEGLEAAQLRAVLKNYSVVHLLRVLPQLAAVTLVETVAALVTGHLSRARVALRPWRVNLGNARSILAARKSLRAVRAVPDHDVRDLQWRGNARVRALWRGAGAAAADPLRSSRLDLATSWRDDGLRLTVGVWAVVVMVLGFGTRHLIGSHLPIIGEFAPIPSTGTMWHQAISGWRLTGMGSPSPAPTSFALLAAAGALVAGHVTFLERLLVLGTVPVGVVGAFRLGRPFGSRRARLVTTVLYVGNPLAYNALAQGHWSGLMAYAAMPWVLLILAGATGLAPFTVEAPVSLRYRMVVLGLVLAVAGAFVPSLIPMVVIVAGVLVAGSLLGGGARSTVRAVAVAVGGAGVAVGLLFPWVIGLLPPGGEWARVIRVAPGSGHSARLAELLRFQTGPTGATPLGWALLATAALPLVVGSEWRFAWATRLWAVAVSSWALAWVGGRGWLPFPSPPVEVLLAPAAAALATCAGLGLAAFEIDLRGYHFGWRQLVSTVAAAAAVVAVLPVLGSAADGRWHAPSEGFESVLSWMPDKRVDGDFRVLWVGDPEVLPIAGWRLAGGLAYATSRNGLADVTTAWPGTSRGSTRLLAQGITLAEATRTTQLGRILAPLAVRYVVVVQRSAPASEPGEARPVPAGLIDGLQSQVDLRRIDSDTSLVVYENAAWAPARAELPAAAAAASQSDDPSSARTVDLSAAKPVLPVQRGATSFAGPVDGPSRILLSEAPSDRWRLRVGGTDAPRHTAFGSVNSFVVAHGGAAEVFYATPAIRGVALGVQGGLWLVVVGWLWRRRRRRPRPAGDAVDVREPPVRVDAPVEVGV